MTRREINPGQDISPRTIFRSVLKIPGFGDAVHSAAPVIYASALQPKHPRQLSEFMALNLGQKEPIFSQTQRQKLADHPLLCFFL
jgi:hypothetical protein